MIVDAVDYVDFADGVLPADVQRVVDGLDEPPYPVSIVGHDFSHSVGIACDGDEVRYYLAFLSGHRGRHRAVGRSEFAQRFTADWTRHLDGVTALNRLLESLRGIVRDAGLNADHCCVYEHDHDPDGVSAWVYFTGVEQVLTSGQAVRYSGSETEMWSRYGAPLVGLDGVGSDVVNASWFHVAIWCHEKDGGLVQVSGLDGLITPEEAVRFITDDENFALFKHSGPIADTSSSSDPSATRTERRNSPGL